MGRGIASGRSEFSQTYLPPLELSLILISLAYHEMRLILAKVLYSFDIELCSQSSHWTNHKVYTLWEKPPMYVKLKPRVEA